MTKPFKMWIKDKKTLEKVAKQMDKDGIIWGSGNRASHIIHKYTVPIALFVNSGNLLSWSTNKQYFKCAEYSEITPEEYLKENKTMIKIGDIVRVTDWGCAYPTNDEWFYNHKNELELEWMVKYSYGDEENYIEHQYDDDSFYQVLYVDKNEEKCLIMLNKDYSYMSNVYLIGLNGVKLYDKPTEMTISEIEEKLGIKNLKIVKENENG